MASYCHYNCSEPTPTWVSSNDITGIGVIVSYIVTAGLAVLIISVYYLAVYDPTRDPFGKSDRDVTTRQYRPNPVDEIVLRCLRHGPRWVMKTYRLITIILFFPVGTNIAQCILAMSDLQLVTGFSILIVVNLAWFSTLTHLSCLTLVRNHLYNHTGQRIWRLLAMAMLATLLVVGLIFTGNYDWVFGGSPPDLTDYAICYLHADAYPSDAFYSMTAAVLLIIFAFISRVVRMHRILSVGVFGRARRWLSVQAQQVLRIVFTWCDSPSPLKSLQVALCYRPLLAVYLSARFLLDGWTSMFVEVSWLIVAFAWGIYRLLVAIYVAKGRELPINFDNKSSNWTFGQVVAMVLLLAPLITILEYFEEDVVERDEQGEAYEFLSSIVPAANSPGATSHAILETTGLNDSADDPSNGWKHYKNTLLVAVIYTVNVCLVMITLLVVASMGKATPLAYFIYAGMTNSLLSITIPFAGLILVILFSLVIEIDLSNQHRWLQFLLQSLNVVSFPSFTFCFFFQHISFIFPSASDVNVFYLPLSVNFFPVYVFGIYILGAVIHWLFVARRKICRRPV